MLHIVRKHEPDPTAGLTLLSATPDICLAETDDLWAEQNGNGSGAGAGVGVGNNKSREGKEGGEESREIGEYHSVRSEL